METHLIIDYCWWISFIGRAFPGFSRPALEQRCAWCLLDGKSGFGSQYSHLSLGKNALFHPPTSGAEAAYHVLSRKQSSELWINTLLIQHQQEFFWSWNMTQAENKNDIKQDIEEGKEAAKKAAQS